MRYFFTLFLLLGAAAHAQTEADKACTFIGLSPAEYRETNADDYRSADWDAFRKFTGVDKPWESTGDFDGDGHEDRAYVVINTTRPNWMLGVVFGGDAGGECRSFQISQHEDMTLLPGLQPWRKGQHQWDCHHAGQAYPAVCALILEKDSKFRAFKDSGKDAFAYSDSIPSTGVMIAYWGEWDTKSDGSPIMAFLSQKPFAEIRFPDSTPTEPVL